MPLCSASIWQMLVSHVCLHQCSLSGSWTQTRAAWVDVMDEHARASCRRCRERLRYSGNAAHLVFCLHNSDLFIPPWNTLSLPLDLCSCGASVLHLRRGMQKQLLFETSRDAKKQQPFSVYHCLFLIEGAVVFCPPNTGEPKEIPESWGEHANSTAKTWDGIRHRTSVLSLIKCGHSP